MDMPLLSIRDYHQIFPVDTFHHVHALDGVSFDMYAEEFFGLVGESGCGKSTLARAVMGMYKPSKGKIYYQNQCITDKHISRELKKTLQQDMQIIFQDSSAALNPRMSIEDCIAEPFDIHKLFPNKQERRGQVIKLLAMVGLNSSFLEKIPAEISGGQKQRVCIARALALKPKLIIADEPVSSLDVSIQAQIINLFIKLRKEIGFSLLFIAHDLSMVQYLCERVAVMYKGKIVELAPTQMLFNNPLHPYTKLLLSAIPKPDPDTEKSKTFSSNTEIKLDKTASLQEAEPKHFVLE